MSPGCGGKLVPSSTLYQHLTLSKTIFKPNLPTQGQHIMAFFCKPRNFFPFGGAFFMGS
jgi:hypothetical protein